MAKHTTPMHLNVALEGRLKRLEHVGLTLVTPTPAFMARAVRLHLHREILHLHPDLNVTALKIGVATFVTNQTAVHLLV